MFQPHFYRVRVEGIVSLLWQERFAPLRMEHLPGGETLLSGRIQAADLYPILIKLYDLNLPLNSVESSPSSQPEETRAEG
jgi:hypothetical protein